MLATRDEAWQAGGRPSRAELQPVLLVLWLQVFPSSHLPLTQSPPTPAENLSGHCLCQGTPQHPWAPLSNPEAASRMNSGTFRPCGLAKSLGCQSQSL